MKRLSGLLVAALALLLLPAVADAGGVPLLAVSPAAPDTSPDYGTIAPLSTATKTFTAVNSGGAATGALKTTLSAVSGNAAAFTITADGCSAISLGPKKSCLVRVQYQPAIAGADDTVKLTVSSKKPPGNASITLTGNGTANSPPFPNPDFFAIDADLSLDSGDDVLLGNLLANDFDPDGDPLAIAACSSPVYSSSPDGTLSGSWFGGCSYTFNSDTGFALFTLTGTGDLYFTNVGAFMGLASGQGFQFFFTYLTTDGQATAPSPANVDMRGVLVP